jgi:hypothetical protein
MVAPQLIAAIASAVMMTGFAANEMSHGGFADAMGMGHQHMADWGGYHCAGPDDAHWADHVEHMHGNSTGFEDHCSHRHMDADRGHIGDGSHGPMGPGHDGMGGHA